MQAGSFDVNGSLNGNGSYMRVGPGKVVVGYWCEGW